MSGKPSKTVGDSIEETKDYHTRFLRALNNPIRRDILRALKDREATLETLQEMTGLDPKSIEWHMNILEWGFCVEKELKDGKTLYRLTQEGKVVDFMDKNE